MKTIITSASLAALGALSLQAAYDPGLSATEKAKPWSVSASLRGFYDDNYATLPSERTDGGPTKRGSWGFDVSPRLSLNFPWEASLASLDYIYDARWYADRENNQWDQSHQVTGRFNHAFSENYKLDVADSFVSAQEPEILNPAGTPVSVPLRVNGNNIRNTGTIAFQAQLTRLFGVEVGYQNNYYDYKESGPGSYSALLDRIEHLPHLNLRWNVLQDTVAILGYQYGLINHTSHDSLIAPGAPVFGLRYPADPKLRDSESHYIYAGADHNFTQQLNGSIRAGAQITHYPNINDTSMGSLGHADSDNVIPYVDANLSYSYAKGSYAQLGVKNTLVQTDLYAVDQEATVVYASINHQITAKLMANVIGQYQHASFQQGFTQGVAGGAEDYWVAGLNLTYQINQYLAAEAGYNFDLLNSDAPNRDFTRNRGYLGFRASY